MKLSRELKTGVVALIVISLFIWGFNYLKGKNLFDKSQRVYYSEYKNVQGLNTASAVTISGMVVGKVEEITFDKSPEKKGHLIVKFSINKDFEFSDRSIAKIYSASLMGGKSLAIIPSFDGDIALTGSFLKGEIESDMLSSVEEKLNPLQAKLESVIVSADSLLVGLNDVMDHKSRMHLKNTFSKLETTISTYNSLGDSINKLVSDNSGSIKETLSSLSATSLNFEKISDSLANADLAGTVKDLQFALNNLNKILEGIEQGEGTFGKLMKDDALYNNLEDASKEMAELLEDFKLHPKRYVNVSVFGKKDKGYIENESIEEGEETIKE